MPSRSGTRKTRQIYRFIQANRDDYDVATMCRTLEVTRSGFYAWLKKPLSDRAREDVRLLGLIRASFTASHGIYGARRVFLDLREAGETCSKHRVARLMRVNKLFAAHGYRTRRQSNSKPSVLIPNVLQRQFDVSAPNKAWVIDITYIRTWEGWLYLAVVIDLFSRKVIGWATKPTLGSELALDAVKCQDGLLLLALYCHRPDARLLHSHPDRACIRSVIFIAASEKGFNGSGRQQLY